MALYLILSVVTFPSILSLHDLFHLEPNRGRKEKKEKKEQKNALHFFIFLGNVNDPGGTTFYIPGPAIFKKKEGHPKKEKKVSLALTLFYSAVIKSSFHSPITLANLSSIHLVSIIRCSSPPWNPVYTSF